MSDLVINISTVGIIIGCVIFLVTEQLLTDTAVDVILSAPEIADLIATGEVTRQAAISAVKKHRLFKSFRILDFNNVSAFRWYRSEITLDIYRRLVGIRNGI